MFLGEEDLFARRDESDLWNTKAKVVDYGHGGGNSQPAPPGAGPAESHDRWSRDQDDWRLSDQLTARLREEPRSYDHGHHRRDYEESRPGPSYGQDSRHQDRYSHDQRNYSQER